MKYIKLFESYYEDLTPYSYGGRDKDSLNVGWIGKDQNFEIGDVPIGFIEKLKKAELSDKLTSESHKGFHRCELCGDIMGSQVKKIEYNGKSYKFPSKMSHYVTDHKYLPPQEFIDAIMNVEIEDNVNRPKRFGNPGFRNFK